MRRWILREGWDPSMYGKVLIDDEYFNNPLKEPPTWYEKLYKKELSLMKRERIRQTRRAVQQEYENLWVSHYEGDVDDPLERLYYSPVLTEGHMDVGGMT